MNDPLTTAPWVEVSWPAVAGIEAYVLYRKNLTIAGVAYRLEKSASLAAGSWTDAGVTAAGTGGVQTATVPAAGMSGRYYFRVVVE